MCVCCMCEELPLKSVNIKGNVTGMIQVNTKKKKSSQNKFLGVGNYNQLPKKLYAFLNDFKNDVKFHFTGGVSDKQDAYWH